MPVQLAGQEGLIEKQGGLGLTNDVLRRTFSRKIARDDDGDQDQQSGDDEDADAGDAQKLTSGGWTGHGLILC